MTLSERLTAALGVAPAHIEPLTGGCVGEVYGVRLPGREQVVVKVDDRPQPSLDIEGYMLRYLAEHSDLPVPAVLHESPRLLVMEFMPGRSHFSPTAEQHAAELLAALHDRTAPQAPQFGLERDTLIGGLPQPNPPSPAWLPFFREQRLLYMAGEAQRAGRLPAALYQRLERLAAVLERWLDEPQRPALIHGDVWTSNVLAQGNRITAFLDPAVYYAHPEIELAFITLFGTFGRAFFDRYQELRPIPAGFFETRRHLYNLYPLLVHVRLFGGSYVASVEQTLHRFGF